MLRTRFWKFTAIAGALALAAMAPAAAAGGPPDDRAGAGGSQMRGGEAAIAAPMTPGDGTGGPGGGSGGPPDGVGGGGGSVDSDRPDSAGSGGPPADKGGGGPPAGVGNGKPENPGGGGGKPGGEETSGNNLSYPVVYSEDGYLPPVVPVATPLFAGAVELGADGICYGAVQKDPLNRWAAASALEEDNAVTAIDWGDNLESKDWRAGTVVRVETGLYDNDGTAGMDQYAMCYISGSGTTEVWGAAVTATPGAYTASPILSEDAMVYTGAARLTIQMIDPAAAETITWDPISHVWTGVGAGDVVFNGATYEKGDGPGYYGAELNVQGKVVYGYVWQTRGLAAGEYRLTVSLDEENNAFTGTSLTFAGAEIMVPVEEPTTVVTRAEDGGGGNTAYVGTAGYDNLTYIDVGLTTGSGGGRK